jgi:hypothetical protein
MRFINMPKIDLLTTLYFYVFSIQFYLHGMHKEVYYMFHHRQSSMEKL